MDKELLRDYFTDCIYDNTYFGEPVEPHNADSVIDGIRRATELEKEPAFISGLADRLTQLGVSCTVSDTNIMLAEVKRRYKELLGFPCPPTVQKWIKGTPPGVTNRRNNYDLCYALEMDLRQTGVFFQKHFLTIPFNVKSRTDAVFMYALYHKKSYSEAVDLLENASGFVSQENAHTATMQIASVILNTDDDNDFLQYLSEHCYNNEQQFQLARSIIISEVDILQDTLRKYNEADIVSPNRLGSLTVDALLGFKYQEKDKRIKSGRLPKRFTESLPNDLTLGKILNGKTASYDLLRKTLMLLKFYNFYYEADNFDPTNINENLKDFCTELNETLFSCGFAQLYMCHPFDCLLMYSANSYEPIDTLYCVIENARN